MGSGSSRSAASSLMKREVVHLSWLREEGSTARTPSTFSVIAARG
jgi:hypothetical protein